MCCDGWDISNEVEEIKECPACGEDVDEYGNAVTGCNYSPISCTFCGAAPCNESC